jgi:hypothetical protein
MNLFKTSQIYRLKKQKKIDLGSFIAVTNIAEILLGMRLSIMKTKLTS